MSDIIYARGRNVINQNGVYENVKAEFINIFLANKALLEQELDQAETYSFNQNGFKILDKNCEPIRMIECNHLIIKDNVVVGSVILRVNNTLPTHGNRLIQDCLDRTFELRFKTFAGCDYTVESSGMAITQRNNGVLLINSGCGTGFSDLILKRHWDEFKTNCTFTQAEIQNPTKKTLWTKLYSVFSQ